MTDEIMDSVLGDALTHDQVEAGDWVRLYGLGRLSEEQEAAFEEHLMECSECFEQVRWDDELAQGVKDVAAEEVARVAVQASLWQRLAAATAQGRGWMLAVLLAAAIPSTLWWQQRVQLDEMLSPSTHTSLYSIGVTRQGSTSPATVLPWDDEASRWWVLQVELPRVESESYDVVLLDADGNQVWSQKGIPPDANESLVVSLHSSVLHSGRWTMRLLPEGAPDKVFEVPLEVR